MLKQWCCSVKMCIPIPADGDSRVFKIICNACGESKILSALHLYNKANRSICWSISSTPRSVFWWSGLLNRCQGGTSGHDTRLCLVQSYIHAISIPHCITKRQGGTLFRVGLLAHEERHHSTDCRSPKVQIRILNTKTQLEIDPGRSDCKSGMLPWLC